MKKWIWIIIVVIVAILIAVLLSGSKDTSVIKIGVIGPLSGDAAVFGEPINNAVNLAEKQINAAGGVNGRMVQLISEDGKCDGSTAVSAAQKLINVDGVKFIIGGTCSSETLAIAPIVDAAKILVISPSATSPKISGVSKYVFRNAPSDAGRGVVIGDYVLKSYKKIAAITEQTDYAQGITATFIAELQKNNVSLVANEVFSEKTTDFRSILLKIKQAEPEIILLSPQTPANLVRLAQQARTMGINAQFITAEFNDPTVVTAGSITEGMVIAIAPSLSTQGRGGDLLSAYKAEFGKDATYPYYVGAAYDDLNLLLSGIAKYGEDTTKVRDYLSNLKAYNGTLGTYSFDQNGDIVGINFVFQKIIGGKLVDIK